MRRELASSSSRREVFLGTIIVEDWILGINELVELSSEAIISDGSLRLNPLSVVDIHWTSRSASTTTTWAVMIHHWRFIQRLNICMRWNPHMLPWRCQLLGFTYNHTDILLLVKHYLWHDLDIFHFFVIPSILDLLLNFLHRLSFGEILNLVVYLSASLLG